MSIYIKKLNHKWKNFHEQKVFFFRFYILCENFSKIRPIIKKVPNFVNDPLKCKIRNIYALLCSLGTSFVARRLSLSTLL